LNLEEGKVSSFELKLLDLNQELLAIYDTDAKAQITMNAAEFSRICRDLGTIGDTGMNFLFIKNMYKIVTIDAQKDGVSFSVNGDELSGNITLRPSDSVDDVLKYIF
jgi:proliferating cell nuclear antigen